MHNERISAFLSDRISKNDFPSAVYLVAEKGEIVFQGGLGNAVVQPELIRAGTNTIYDVASLTKVLVTGLLAALAIERGDIDPNEPIGAVLSEFHGSSNGDLTPDLLVTHRTGLPAWKPLYLLVEHGDEVLLEIARTLSSANAESVIYSDLNFITLGAVLERIYDAELDDIFHREVAAPLGLANTMFRPPIELRRQIAASEIGNEYELRMCMDGEYDLSVFGRGRSFLRTDTIWGEVHDGNAFFMGGVAGHAGLFSTASDIFNIALQFIPAHTTLFRPETCRLFDTNLTSGMTEDRSFAFQLASTKGSTAGAALPPESFGHTGFSGTSLWIDGVNDRIFVLLTNRTHAHPLPFANINGIRRQFHEIAADELNKKISNH